MGDLEQADETPRGRPKVFIWVAGGLAAAIVGATVGELLFRSPYPLPTKIVKSAGFPLYYPTPMIPNSKYKPGSARTDGNLVFYDIMDGQDELTVAEQAEPPTPPDLSLLAGFKSLNTVAGQAVVGTSRTKEPIVIISSNTTLVTISAGAQVPSDEVSELAQNMRSLPQ